MDFLDRLRRLMDKNNDNNSTLAKKSGVPYTTIDGLFKRGWEKAQISTIKKLCDYYNVSMDYMVYGASGLSEEAQDLAARYDNLDESGKKLVSVIMETQVERMAKQARPHKKIPSAETIPDDELYDRYSKDMI